MPDTTPDRKTFTADDPATTIDHEAARRMEEAMANEGVEEIEAPETPEKAPETTETPEPEQNEPETPPRPENEPSSEPEEKAEEPEKVETEEKPSEPEPDDVEKEIEGFKLKDSAKPVTRKNFEGLRKVASTEHKKAKAAEARARELAAELEKAQSVKPLDEETEQKLKRLETYYRQREIGTDPELTKEFDEPLKQVHAQAFEAIKPLLPEATAKFIEDKGGILKFRVSQEQMPYARNDGTPYTCAEFYEELMRPKLTPGQQDDIQAAAMEDRRLNFAKQAKINEAKRDIETDQAKLQERTQKQQEEWAARIKAQLEKDQKDFGEWATPKEVPLNATAAEKAEIDAHNATVERGKGIIARNLQSLTPETHAHMAAAVARMEILYPKLEATVAEKDKAIATKDARIAELETKLDDIKNAGKTSHRSSAPAVPTKPAPPKNLSAEDRMTLMMQGKL